MDIPRTEPKTLAHIKIRDIPLSYWYKLSREQLKDFLCLNGWLDPLYDLYDTCKVLFTYYLNHYPDVLIITQPIEDIIIAAALPKNIHYEIKALYGLTDEEYSFLIDQFREVSGLKLSNIPHERLVTILRLAGLVIEETDPSVMSIDLMNEDVINIIGLNLNPDTANSFCNAMSDIPLLRGLCSGPFWSNKFEHDYNVILNLDSSNYASYIKNANYLIKSQIDTSPYFNRNKIMEMYKEVINGNFYKAHQILVSLNSNENFKNILLLYYIGLGIHYGSHLTTNIFLEETHKYRPYAPLLSPHPINLQLENVHENVIANNKLNDYIAEYMKIDTPLYYPEYIRNIYEDKKVPLNLDLLVFTHRPSNYLWMGLLISAIITGNNNYIQAARNFRRRADIFNTEYNNASFIAACITGDMSLIKNIIPFLKYVEFYIILFDNLNIFREVFSKFGNIINLRNIELYLEYGGSNIIKYIYTDIYPTNVPNISHSLNVGNYDILVPLIHVDISKWKTTRIEYPNYILLLDRRMYDRIHDLLLKLLRVKNIKHNDHIYKSIELLLNPFREIYKSGAVDVDSMINNVSKYVSYTIENNNLPVFRLLLNLKDVIPEMYDIIMRILQETGKTSYIQYLPKQ